MATWPRLWKAAMQGLGYDPIVLPKKKDCSGANWFNSPRGTESPWRMGKRTGEFVKALEKVVGVKWAATPALFFFLMRKSTAHLDFPTWDLWPEQSSENPFFFYVQYAPMPGVASIFRASDRQAAYSWATVCPSRGAT